MYLVQLTIFSSVHEVKIFVKCTKNSVPIQRTWNFRRFCKKFGSMNRFFVHGEEWNLPFFKDSVNFSYVNILMSNIRLICQCILTAIMS